MFNYLCGANEALLVVHVCQILALLIFLKANNTSVMREVHFSNLHLLTGPLYFFTVYIQNC